MNVQKPKTFEGLDFVSLNKFYVMKHHCDPDASCKHKEKLLLCERNSSMDVFNHIKLPKCIDTFTSVEDAVKIAQLRQIMMETVSTNCDTLTICKEFNDLIGIDSLLVINEALGYRNSDSTH